MGWVSGHTLHVRVSLVEAVGFHSFFFSPQSSFVQLCRLSRGFAPKPSRYSQLLSCVSHEINPVSVLRLLLAPAAI